MDQNCACWVKFGVDFLVDLVVGNEVFSKASCVDDLLVGLGVVVGWLVQVPEPS